LPKQKAYNGVLRSRILHFFKEFQMKKLAFLFVALFCVSAFADDLPRIAVYVTGDVPNNEKKALGTRILSSLINSGRYRGIERSNSFLAEIEKEQIKQRSGAIDDSQIRELGKQFGVTFVCIADITPAFGDFQVSARIVDVETAEVIFIGDASGQLKSMADLTTVSDKVIESMFVGRKTRTAPEPKPIVPKPMFVPEPTPAPAAVILTKTEPPKIEPRPEPEPANLDNQENVETDKAESEHKPEPTEKLYSKYRRLQKKIGIEAGGVLPSFSWCDYSGYGYNYRWDEDGINNPSSDSYYGLGGGGYLHLDLIYVEIYYDIVGDGRSSGFGGIGIVAKCPIVYESIKVFPLLGLGIIGNEGGGFGASGAPLILGGGIDIGISEIAYIRSEYRYGGLDKIGSAMSFTIGGGLDIGLGERKKAYLRTELLYKYMDGTNESNISVTRTDGKYNDEISRHSVEFRIGIGYKWGGGKKPKEPRPPKTAELSDFEEF
jgi:hypothetical protein